MAKMTLVNIAKAGFFSSDRTIGEYTEISGSFRRRSKMKEQAEFYCRCFPCRQNTGSGAFPKTRTNSSTCSKVQGRATGSSCRWDRLVTGTFPVPVFLAHMQAIPILSTLKTLVREGLLTKKECKEYDFGGKEGYVEYEKIYRARFRALKKAYERFEKMKPTKRLWKKTRTGLMITASIWRSRTAKAA